MRQLSQNVLVFTALLLIPSATPAQSAWEKLKQAAKQTPQATKNSGQPASAQRQTSDPANQGFHETAETGTPQLTASLAASAGFIEVTGVKLGMRAKDVPSIIKAHNGALQITPETYVHQLIPGQTLTSGIHAKTPVVSGQIFEQYEVAFTTQPNDSFVMAVGHRVHYPRGQQPTYTSAIEGMRAKYGKENYVPRAFPAGASFFWVMDTQGHPVAGTDLQRIVETCTSPFLAEQWQSASDTVTKGYDERKLSIGALRCSSYATVGVYFQGSLIPGQTTYLLDDLLVVATNGALYRSAVETTHGQYLAAQKKVDDNKMKDAEKKGVAF